MIRLSFTSKGKLLDNLSAYLASLQENVNQTQKQVVDEVEPTVLDELGYTPDASPWSKDNPIPWTSALQGVAFHASGGFGSGIPHTRTNALPDGWIVTNDGNGKTTIANNAPGALYVYGSLSKTNPGAHQQYFLAIAGWPAMYKTVRYWGDYIADETFKRIKDQFGDLGQRDHDFEGIYEALMTLATLADMQAEIKAQPNQTNSNAPEVLNGNEYFMEAAHFVDDRITKLKHEEYAPRKQVRYFDAPPYIPLDPNLRCVILDRPLVETISVQYADAVLTQWTPDQSFAARKSTDFYLTPIGRTPYRLLYPTERYQTWTPLAQYGQSSSQQVIRMDALWCYRTYYADNAWIDSAQTVQNNPLTVSGTDLQVTTTGAFSPGMWIRFKDASPVAACEIAEITDIPSATTLTLLRGGAAARGTTPTQHLQECEIDIFQPEPIVVRCAQRWAAYLYNRRNVYEQLKVTMGASGSISQFFPQDVPEECKGILADLPVFGTYTIGSMDRDG